jgi:GT2 family glycosyltransferase
MSVCAVIVTYNRLQLLERCVDAMLRQSQPPDCILIIDNASTDGTCDRMRERSEAEPLIRYHAVSHNSGGAGGFHEGLRVAREAGFDWTWVMDDDAEPHADALQELMQRATKPEHMYGSVAVNGENVSWAIELVEQVPPKRVERTADVPDIAVVRFLPFLGVLVSRQLVDRIGLPDAGFFIAADDVEYSMRAQAAGAKVHVVGRSRISHPRADVYTFDAPGRRLFCIRLVPWKRYYDTRNRLLIARKYYGFRMFTQTLPGTAMRWLACMVREKHPAQQTWAFFAGVVDGILGRKGPRHTAWRIKP